MVKWKHGCLQNSYAPVRFWSWPPETMKTTAFKIILVVSALFLVLTNRAKAQAFDSNKAYQDYQYSLGVYQTSYSAYQASKDFYLKSPTLTLKEDARKKTLAMLRDRDQLISVYITMLRMNILGVKGLSNDEKNTIFGKLDPEVKWYQDHKSSYQDGDPLETLFTKSTEAADRYKATTQPIIYETLFNISLGTEVGIRMDHEEIYTNLKSIVDSGVASGKLDMNPFNRWFSDIDTTISQLKINDDKAKAKIVNVYGQYYSIVGSYNSGTDTLATSLTSLSELNRFLTEVLTSIKNQQ